MVMFDYFTIYRKFLPEDAQIPEEDQDFQTKDFNCLLERYEVLPDGRLIVLELDDNADLKDYHGLDWIDYTGTISFYTWIGKHWREFTATFVEGRLKEVIEIENKS